MTEFQNKTHFLNCKPILNVKDVAASIDYYCNNLGFTKVFSWKDEVGFCDSGMFTFAEVQRGGANIMLSFQKQIYKGFWIYLDLNNAEEHELIYQEFKTRDAFIVDPPNYKPWSMYEMVIKDLDDNFLRIGAPSSNKETIDN